MATLNVGRLIRKVHGGNLAARGWRTVGGRTAGCGRMAPAGTRALTSQCHRPSARGPQISATLTG